MKDHVMRHQVYQHHLSWMTLSLHGCLPPLLIINTFISLTITIHNCKEIYAVY